MSLVISKDEAIDAYPVEWVISPVDKKLRFYVKSMGRISPTPIWTENVNEDYRFPGYYPLAGDEKYMFYEFLTPDQMRKKLTQTFKNMQFYKKNNKMEFFFITFRVDD